MIIIISHAVLKFKTHECTYECTYELQKRFPSENSDPYCLVPECASSDIGLEDVHFVELTDGRNECKTVSTVRT